MASAYLLCDVGQTHIEQQLAQHVLKADERRMPVLKLAAVLAYAG